MRCEIYFGEKVYLEAEKQKGIYVVLFPAAASLSSCFLGEAGGAQMCFSPPVFRKLIAIFFWKLCNFVIMKNTTVFQNAAAYTLSHIA